MQTGGGESNINCPKHLLVSTNSKGSATEAAEAYEEKLRRKLERESNDNGRKKDADMESISSVKNSKKTAKQIWALSSPMLSTSIGAAVKNNKIKHSKRAERNIGPMSSSMPPKINTAIDYYEKKVRQKFERENRSASMPVNNTDMARREGGGSNNIVIHRGDESTRSAETHCSTAYTPARNYPRQPTRDTTFKERLKQKLESGWKVGDRKQ